MRFHVDVVIDMLLIQQISSIYIWFVFTSYKKRRYANITFWMVVVQVYIEQQYV